MNSEQWQTLCDIVNGKPVESIQTGFIIDSPWLPGWSDISIMDYFTSDDLWFKTNLKAIETFPDTIFLPGFWSEFGMCTEPSAFGSKLVWESSQLPHSEKIIEDINEVGSIVRPDVRKDGLLPFVINRMKLAEPRMKAIGHEFRFAVARGPFNIASFLMGTTEFMMAMAMEREKTEELISLITDFVIEWLEYQIEMFPSIDGILILDDIIGFVGEGDFKDMMLPYLKKIFQTIPATVKFLHNDAAGLVSAPYLKEIGVNLFNFSFEHDIAEMKKLVGDSVALIGNIPPRDILANGTPEEIRMWCKKTCGQFDKNSGIIWSCGGGMPQGVSTENINVFTEAVNSLNQ